MKITRGKSKLLSNYRTSCQLSKPQSPRSLSLSRQHRRNAPHCNRSLNNQSQLLQENIQQQEQASVLTTTREELRNLHLQINATAPGPPRSEIRGQHASSSNTRGTSALHAMIEGTRHFTDTQHNVITELKRELTSTRREREELQASMERMVESPHSHEEGSLNSSDLPTAYTSPRKAIYHQLMVHILPFTNIMQCYEAMRDLHLLTSKLPILKT